MDRAVQTDLWWTGQEASHAGTRCLVYGTTLVNITVLYCLSWLSVASVSSSIRSAKTEKM